jgi:arylsulfatase A-like enzyme
VQTFVCGLLIAWIGACFAPRDVAPVLTADMPLHLEDHLDAALIEGSEMPVDPPEVVEWRFDEPQPDWKVAVPLVQRFGSAQVERTAEALRVTPAHDLLPDGTLRGGVYVDLPDWRRGDWTAVVVTARTTGGVYNLVVGLNPRESVNPNNPGWGAPVQVVGGNSPIVQDGAIHTYQIRPNWRRVPPTTPWRRLGLFFDAREPGSSIDVLTVRIVPTAAVYAAAGHGVASVAAGDVHRSLFTHAPARVAFQVRVPEGGRLSTALGVLGGDSPVAFRIVAQPEAADATVLLSETHADPTRWAERSVDLTRFANQTISLALETDATQAGTVAFWGAPTLSGVRRTDTPNIIFYIIDGGSADYMSVYGYNRRTTPNLERLAAEGALFERAYSNSSWTRPSTVSFLTSLHHSVLGGFRQGPGNPVPEEVSTIGEHLHRAGYQTAEFTSNPNAGRLSNLDRGNDIFRDDIDPPPSTSSVELHERFWQWRAAYPGEPYWVHFQTTDVHSDHFPVPPFAGLFISSDRRRLLDTWDERLDQARAAGATFDTALDETGIHRAEYFAAQRDLHDETMAHQDYQLGRLVARLKAQGEWERTLLIVAADHGVDAGADDYGILMREPPPADREAGDSESRRSWLEGGGRAALFASGVSRIPLIIVWPGQIAPGQRFGDPVSMIDMLPTILDLVDLPLPAVMQGQSLAPLLLGETGWEPRPVILDEFAVDAVTGELQGWIEVIEGRWGASLEINPFGPAFQRRGTRPVPMLLFDLWNDPMCLHSLHEERPDLVEKYTKFLEGQFEAHLALGRQLTASEASPLTREQLEALRALGYIR